MAQQEDQAIVRVKNKAYFVSPPNPAGGGLTSRAVWSPDSRFVLSVRTAINWATVNIAAPPTENRGSEQTEVSLYDVTNRRLTVAVRLPIEVRVSEVDWLVGGGLALVTATKSDQERPDYLLYAVYRGGTGQNLLQVNEPIRVFSSPAAPFALIGIGETTLRILTPDSRLSNAIPLPGALDTVTWDTSGQPVLYVRAGLAPAGRPAPTMAKLDMATGRLVPVTEDPETWDEPPSTVFDITAGTVPVPLPRGSGTFNMVVLQDAHANSQEDDKGTAIVSTDGRFAQMSPDGKWLLYVSRGIPVVSRVMPVDLKLYEDQMRAMEKTRLISNAKQTALAILMYAADNNENTPPFGNFQDQIYPYVRNRDTMAGFVLVLGGADLSKVQNPTTTVLGYIAGPGGRAVAYADGSVRWLND
jgi:hypothetical protein